MKILIEGYNKSIHKRDNQLLIKEKDDELEKININKKCRLIRTDISIYNISIYLMTNFLVSSVLPNIFTI